MNAGARSTAASLAMAGPAVLATIMIVAFSGFELLGRTPFAVGPFRNVAEAAGMGAASDVLRMLGNGEDPNRVMPVRGEIISSSVKQATALEAAIWSRRLELLELLDRRGAIVDMQTRRHLACLASDLSATDIAEYLSRHASPDCVRGHELDVVLDRTRRLEP
jgi:hypothetical protein